MRTFDIGNPYNEMICKEADRLLQAEPPAPAPVRALVQPDAVLHHRDLQPQGGELLLGRAGAGLLPLLHPGHPHRGGHQGPRQVPRGGITGN